MLSKVADTIKTSVAGVTTSGVFLTISFVDLLQWIQIVSAVLSIGVAFLTAYLTILKIRKEKKES